MEEHEEGSGESLPPRSWRRNKNTKKNIIVTIIVALSLTLLILRSIFSGVRGVAGFEGVEEEESGEGEEQ